MISYAQDRLYKQILYDQVPKKLNIIKMTMDTLHVFIFNLDPFET